MKYLTNLCFIGYLLSLANLVLASEHTDQSPYPTEFVMPDGNSPITFSYFNNKTKIWDIRLYSKEKTENRLIGFLAIVPHCLSETTGYCSAEYIVYKEYPKGLYKLVGSYMHRPTKEVWSAVWASPENCYNEQTSKIELLMLLYPSEKRLILTIDENDIGHRIELADDIKLDYCVKSELFSQTSAFERRIKGVGKN